ncbi:AFR590Wp [Eremothecium gossypii ATCC 10895]|uniref:AFR590Wp n=1 Tax=Eremothecium gossypii (strain ATCC 10895 / CBS 109.51 / FGSC 9923 / NRRL Y-1056) TaxID=284811 RepID=Q752I5_EREGS|nr:AFR590Wp [Eremothecium gossypii ATCC 10895]AAS53961.2 AFR590Wp [Eremothecium gossypii ATCC 10895]AEY98274.1 FAFR590Wp [Eremothecium gossypii FDAG1]
MKYGPLAFLVLTLLWGMQPAAADFRLSAPRNRAVVSVSRGAARVRLEWKDDGDEPQLSDIDNVKILLCGGPNANLVCLPEAEFLGSLDKNAIRKGSYDVEIRQGVVHDGVYLFQLYSTMNRGHTIQYTQRFQLRGMTGTRALPESSDLDPPARAVQIAGLEPWRVPYTLQTGRIRHAPMQTQPGTKVTARTWTRRYPTTGVSYFPSPIPTLLLQDSTVTMGWSYTMSSAVNYAPHAPFPSAIGWYDPAERLTKRPRRLNVIKTLPSSTTSSSGASAATTT